MSSRTFLDTVRTASGITLLIEASNSREADSRARAPAIARELSRLIRESISRVESVEPHRGPSHLVGGKLVFRDELFR